MKSARPKLVDWTHEDANALLERAMAAQLSAEDCGKLKTLLETLFWLMTQLETMGTTIAILRRAFSINVKKTEKTCEVLRRAGEEQRPREGEEGSTETGKEKKKPKGHGRHGADAYTGAERVRVRHETLKAGDPCPECEAGKLYPQKPTRLIRLRGQAPISATLWVLEKLRCHLCGKIFTATAPEGIGEKTHDESVVSILALMKYGSGQPFNRLERLEKNLGIPLPVSTQWDIVNGAREDLEPVYQELIWSAAQGEIVYNDDTPMKILAFLQENERLLARGSPGRTGIFTSGVVSLWKGRQIAVFFTGRRHAGENLVEVLGKREEGLSPPIQMCDGSSRNSPEGVEAIVANCLAHGRRKFVEVTESFPSECVYVLERLRVVYKNDAFARRAQMPAQERLGYHQNHSAEVMEQLQRWMNDQLEEKRVEPNSSLGKAFSYMLKRWEALTLFLREPGAPLDNNICERALKKAILHRKNALFYKTENGARVGDIFMSLIYTAELAGENPFDYLVELQKHAKEVKAAPHQWLPWSYRETLAVHGETAD